MAMKVISFCSFHCTGGYLIRHADPGFAYDSCRDQHSQRVVGARRPCARPYHRSNDLFYAGARAGHLLVDEAMLDAVFERRAAVALNHWQAWFR